MSSSTVHRHQIQFTSPPSQIVPRDSGRVTLANMLKRPFLEGVQSPQSANIRHLSSASLQEVDDSARQRREMQHLSELLSSLRDAIQASEERRQASLAEMQQFAIELSVAVASQLVSQAIEQGQFAVEELIRSGVSQFDQDQQLTVSLHPEDRQLLDARCTRDNLPWSENICVRSDASLERGDCRIEQADGQSLVSRMSARLAEIRRHWMEDLDDAQIERRQAQGTNRPVRRFPDRRETA